MSSIREDLRRVNIHERDFQKYSADRKIYCVPVDEVRLLVPRYTMPFSDVCSDAARLKYEIRWPDVGEARRDTARDSTRCAT